MSNQAKTHLNNVLPQSQFQFGEYLSNGFDIWKKEAGPFIGFGLLYIVIAIGVGLIPLIGPILNRIMIGPCLMAGAFYFSYKSKIKNSAQFGDFFDKFSSLGPIILLALILCIVKLMLYLPFIASLGLQNFWAIAADANPTQIADLLVESFQPWKFLLLIPTAFVGALFGYSLLFLIFYDLSPVDAIHYSVKYIFKHWILYVLYAIFVFILSFIGIIGLGIGIFITYTFMFPMIFDSFRGLTQLEKYENKDGKDDVLDLLVEQY